MSLILGTPGFLWIPIGTFRGCKHPLSHTFLQRLLSDSSTEKHVHSESYPAFSWVTFAALSAPTTPTLMELCLWSDICVETALVRSSHPYAPTPGESLLPRVGRKASRLLLSLITLDRSARSRIPPSRPLLSNHPAQGNLSSTRGIQEAAISEDILL